MSISMDDKTLIRLLLAIIIGLIGWSAHREIFRVDRGVTVLHGRINSTVESKADKDDLRRVESELKDKASKDYAQRISDRVSGKMDKEQYYRELNFVWKEFDKLRNKSCGQ